MKTGQSKHHTESRTFDIPMEVLHHQCGLPADAGWDLAHVKTDLATVPMSDPSRPSLARVVQVRFERKTA